MFPWMSSFQNPLSKLMHIQAHTFTVHIRSLVKALNNKDPSKMASKSVDTGWAQLI